MCFSSSRPQYWLSESSQHIPPTTCDHLSAPCILTVSPVPRNLRANVCNRSSRDTVTVGDRRWSMTQAYRRAFDRRRRSSCSTQNAMHKSFHMSFTAACDRIAHMPHVPAHMPHVPSNKFQFELISDNMTLSPTHASMRAPAPKVLFGLAKLQELSSAMRFNRLGTSAQ